MSTRRPRDAEGLDERLRALARIAPEAGIFSDFDGALSEIVASAEDARAVAGAAEALAELARRFAVVAVLSGRSAESLGARLTAPGARMFGLHGVEELTASGVRALPEAEAHRAAVERAAARIEAALTEGAILERKGLALAVHVRGARDPEAAMRAIEPVVRAAAEGLVVQAGRRILEVRAPVAVDKGTVVRRLIEEHALRGALVVGDDRGDLAMFDAVDGLELAVRVAVSSDEAPPELLARADARARGPADVVALLEGLAARCDGVAG